MKQRKRIGELMVEVGLITPAQLQHALAVQAKHKGRLGDVLLSEGLITEEQLIEVLDYQLGIPHVQLYRHHIEQEIIDLILPAACRAVPGASPAHRGLEADCSHGGSAGLLRARRIAACDGLSD